MPFEATFKALADATRRQILELLRAGPRSAGDLAARFGLSAATVSHHLAVLRDAARRQAAVDLVTVDQRGTRTARRVVPMAVAGGRVRCRVPEREAEVVVPLHRVVSASTVE